MLENHMVISRANDMSDPQNWPDHDGFCDDCGNLRGSDECCAHHCDKILCSYCAEVCPGCGHAYCQEHAHLLDRSGRCEDCWIEEPEPEPFLCEPLDTSSDLVIS